LFDEVRRVLRVKHYSMRTEVVYLGWIRRFIVANGRASACDGGAGEWSGFLSSLAVDGQVAASTQNQALSALLFLYKEVLGIELALDGGRDRAKAARRLPTVLSRGRCRTCWQQAGGRPWLLVEPAVWHRGCA
jgi:hypothetical protein